MNSISFRNFNSIRVGIFFVLAFFLFSGFIFFAACGFFVYYQVSDRIIPGVSVGSTDLGGMRIADAAIELHKAWNLEKQIVVTNGIDTLAMQPAQLGLQLDALSTVQRAYTVGHSDSTLDHLGQFIVSMKDGRQVAPDLKYNEEEARSGILSLSPTMSKPAVDATIAFQGAQLIAIPGEIGYSINLEETLAAITANPQALMDTSILQIRLRPETPSVLDITPVLAEAENFINTPAGFFAYDALRNETLDYPISKEALVSWLTLQAGQTGPEISLDPSRIASSLDQFSPTLGEGRYFETAHNSLLILQAVLRGEKPTIMVNHHPTAYTVQPGDTLLRIGWKLEIPFWMIVRANPGMDPDKLTSGAELVIPSKDELVPLPVIPNKRIVISIPKQRLWVYQNGDLLAEHVISTGIDKSPTQPGIFQVQTHDKNAYASVWDLYMPNFLGIYEAWPGFMNGIHGLPTLSSGQRLWANVLGKPASYGCIILNLEAAKWLYEWADAGVIVEIRS